MKILVTLILLIISPSLYGSQDLVTLGYTGDTCKSFNEGVEKYGEDFGRYIILAHLTGMNVASSWLMDGDLKILNHDTSDFIYQLVLNECKKNEQDEYPVLILYEYWFSLPNS